MNYKVKNKYGEIRTATEEDKAELIRLGKRREEDFIEESKYDSLVKAGDEDPLAKPLPAENGNNIKRDLKSKRYLLNKLSGLYKGDLNAFVDSMVKGNRPTLNTEDQRQFYSLASKILNAQNFDDAYNKIGEDENNRYDQYLSNVINREALYRNDRGQIRQPEPFEMVLPNLAERQASGSGFVPQAIGFVHDVLSAPTRPITAAASMLTPYGDNLTFGQQVARPVGASTGPENFLDFAVTSVAPGFLVSKGFELATKTPKVGKVLEYIPGVSKTEKLADAIRNVSVPPISGKRLIGKSAARGAGTGLAYSLEPSAVLATAPEEESPWSTFSLGLGAGAIGGGILGAGSGAFKAAGARYKGQYIPDELSPYHKELNSRGGSLKRMKAATSRDNELIDAAKYKTDYEKTLKDTEKALKQKIGGERNAVIESIEQNIDASDNIYYPGANAFSAGKLRSYLARKPVDQEDFITKEWQRTNKNLQTRKYRPRAVIDEITRLNKLGKNTKDPDKQMIYRDLATKLRSVEENISPELTAKRAELDDVYKTLELLPAPGKLVNTVAARLNTNTRSEGIDLINAEESVNTLLSKHLPDAKKVDLLTAPMAAIVRNKGDATLGQVVAESVKSATGAIPSVGRFAGNVLKGSAKRAVGTGGYSPAVLSDTPFDLPPNQVEEVPLDLLTSEGSTPVLLKAPTRQWQSVEEMFEEMVKQQNKKS